MRLFARYWLVTLFVLCISGCLLVEVEDQNGNRIQKPSVAYWNGTTWKMLRGLPNEQNALFACESGQPPNGLIDFAIAKPGYQLLRTQVPIQYTKIDVGRSRICPRDTTLEAKKFTLYKEPAGWDPGFHKQCVVSAAQGNFRDTTYCPDDGAWALWINSEKSPFNSCLLDRGFGSSFEPNAPKSPIIFDRIRQPDGSHTRVMGIDFVSAGYCSSGACTHPCGHPEQYWTWFSMIQATGSQKELMPTLADAVMHIDLRLTGRWEAGSNGGAAAFMVFDTRWPRADDPEAQRANTVVLVFDPGAEKMYKTKEVSNDPKMLYAGFGREDGNHIFMSASGWGLPALTQEFQTYTINFLELFRYAQKQYGVYTDAPSPSLVKPIVSIGMEVRDSSTIYIEAKNMYFAPVTRK